MTSETLPAPSAVTEVANLRDVPLAELSAFSLDLLERTIGRVLPERSEDAVRVAAFQSSI